MECGCPFGAARKKWAGSPERCPGMILLPESLPRYSVPLRRSRLACTAPRLSLMPFIQQRYTLSEQPTVYHNTAGLSTFRPPEFAPYKPLLDMPAQFHIMIHAYAPQGRVPRGCPIRRVPFSPSIPKWNNGATKTAGAQRYAAPRAHTHFIPESEDAHHTQMHEHPTP